MSEQGKTCLACGDWMPRGCGYDRCDNCQPEFELEQKLATAEATAADYAKQAAELKEKVERLKGELGAANSNTKQARRETNKIGSENRRLRRLNNELREDNAAFEKRTNRLSKRHERDRINLAKLNRTVSILRYKEEHKMKLYYNNMDWVIANTKEEAEKTIKEIMGEDYLDYDGAKTFEVIPDFLEVTLGITDDPGGPTETKTAGEWARACAKPDLIASREF